MIMKNEKRIIGNERAVEALASICRNYRETALRAIREGGEEVYIPADPRNPETMLEVLAILGGIKSQENSEGIEPCYASLDEFLRGRNGDGTEHKGYFLVDIISKKVIDLRDRKGNSVAQEVKPLNVRTFLNRIREGVVSYF
jgi:hypothetical protein